MAQIWHLVPHAASPAHAPATPVTPVADESVAQRVEQIDARLEIAAAKRDRAEHPVVLPATGTAPAAPPAIHYSGSIAQIIQQAFAPLGPGAVSWAQRVAACESSDNPNAVNSSSGARGLFQIMPGTWAGTPYAHASEFDPVANAKAAAWIYARSGASPWTCG